MSDFTVPPTFTRRRPSTFESVATFAIIAALLMGGWRALASTAVGATLVHLIVQALVPVLNGGDFALPNILSVGFWMTALALFLGYAIVIAIFFFIKTLLTGSAFGRRRVAH